MTWTATPEEQQRRWLLWLYETHPREELIRWARQLRYFRFWRAQGGHVGDGDRLFLSLRAPTEQAVLALFGHFGWQAVRYPPGTAQPQGGVRYTMDEYRKFPVLIREHPTLAQPGKQQLLGRPVDSYVYNGFFTLALRNPDDVWTVDERAVQAAVVIEQELIPPLAHLISESPGKDKHCICPQSYPEYWLPES